MLVCLVSRVQKGGSQAELAESLQIVKLGGNWSERAKTPEGHSDRQLLSAMLTCGWEVVVITRKTWHQQLNSAWERSAQELFVFVSEQHAQQSNQSGATINFRCRASNRHNCLRVH